MTSEPSSWRAASASIALLWASVSRSAEDSLVITSLRIAAIDLRLANHCRRILVRSLVASVLSSMIARVAQHRLEAAGQRLVSQHRVEMHRDFWDADALSFGRNRGVQVRQGLGIVEPCALRHEAFNELEDAIGAIKKAVQ